MTKYLVLQTLPVAAGTVLQLTDDQARRRRHQVEPLEGGLHRSTVIVQFKRGEVFSMEGELPKGHEAFVERVTDSAEAGSGDGRATVQTSAPAAGQPAKAAKAKKDPKAKTPKVEKAKKPAKAKKS